MPRTRPPVPAAPEPPDADPGATDVELTPAEIAAALARRRDKRGMSLDEITQLVEQYREVALADDDDGVAIRRAIVSKLRKVSHSELHPDCKTVPFEVPLMPDGTYFRINQKPYHGHYDLHECEAQQLASLIYEARRVNWERFRDGQSKSTIVDLDDVQARIQAIRAA